MVVAGPLTPAAAGAERVCAHCAGRHGPWRDGLRTLGRSNDTVGSALPGEAPPPTRSTLGLPDVSPRSGSVCTSSVGAARAAAHSLAGVVERVVDPRERPPGGDMRRSRRASSGRWRVRGAGAACGSSGEGSPAGRPSRPRQVFAGLLLPAARPHELEQRAPARAGERRRWPKGSGVCRRSHGSAHRGLGSAPVPAGGVER